MRAPSGRSPIVGMSPRTGNFSRTVSAGEPGASVVNSAPHVPASGRFDVEDVHPALVLDRPDERAVGRDDRLVRVAAEVVERRLDGSVRRALDRVRRVEVEHQDPCRAARHCVGDEDRGQLRGRRGHAPGAHVRRFWGASGSSPPTVEPEASGGRRRPSSSRRWRCSAASRRATAHAATRRRGDGMSKGYRRSLDCAFTGPCRARSFRATPRVRRYNARTLNRFQKLAGLTLATSLLLVTIGVVVRATDSGLGCPDWPLCHGQLIPALDDPKAWIEWIHRTVAVIVGFEILGLADPRVPRPSRPALDPVADARRGRPGRLPGVARPRDGPARQQRRVGHRPPCRGDDARRPAGLPHGSGRLSGAAARSAVRASGSRCLPRSAPPRRSRCCCSDRT